MQLQPAGQYTEMYEYIANMHICRHRRTDTRPGLFTRGCSHNRLLLYSVVQFSFSIMSSRNNDTDREDIGRVWHTANTEDSNNEKRLCIQQLSHICVIFARRKNMHKSDRPLHHHVPLSRFVLANQTHHANSELHDDTVFVVKSSAHGYIRCL